MPLGELQGKVVSVTDTASSLHPSPPPQADLQWLNHGHSEWAMTGQIQLLPLFPPWQCDVKRVHHGSNHAGHHVQAQAGAQAAPSAGAKWKQCKIMPSDVNILTPSLSLYLFEEAGGIEDLRVRPQGRVVGNGPLVHQ